MDRRLVLMAGFALALAGVGCEDRLCHDVGVDPAGRYEITLLELYDEQSSFKFESRVAWGSGFSTGRCGSSAGLSTTATLDLQATGTVEDRSKTCRLISSDLASSSAALMTMGASRDMVVLEQVRAPQPLLYGAENVTAGSCSGSLAFALLDGGAPGGFLSTPTPGQLPPALLYALFLPTGGGCQACDDNFAVRIVKK